MKLLELFAGTQSVSKAFRARGHQTFTIELDKRHPGIDWYQDIGKISAQDILARFGRPDVIWASPVCTTYSVAAISKHRIKEPNGNLRPRTKMAQESDAMIQHVLQLIEDLQPKYYFIENPRGALRKMAFMQGVPRHTVTYCQYNDRRMKPTDIWTNHPDPQFKRPCNYGDTCHEKAPRGSRTGTQGLKGSIFRAMIPRALCRHIVDICER